jgi:uncharacterized Zn-finger protein
MDAKEYAILVDFAGHLIRKRPQLIAGDIVNDAVLFLLDSGQEITVASVKAWMKNHPSIYEHPRIWQDFTKDYLEKRCNRCKEVLPVGCFYIHNLPTARVLSSECKECYCKSEQERASTPEGKLKNAARQKKFREQNPERYKQRQKFWEEQNREKVLAKKKRYREKQKEKKLNSWGYIPTPKTI